MLAGETLLWREKSEYWSLLCVGRDRRELSGMLGALCTRGGKLALGLNAAHSLLSFTQLYWKTAIPVHLQFANLALCHDLGSDDNTHTLI